jgi:hypothetical protein
MGVMVAGALLCFWLGLPSAYETLFGLVWIGLSLTGMALWLWKHDRALRAEDQAARRAAQEQAEQARWAREGRTVPLTPVQQRFLEYEAQRHDPTD